MTTPKHSAQDIAAILSADFLSDRGTDIPLITAAVGQPDESGLLLTMWDASGCCPLRYAALVRSGAPLESALWFMLHEDTAFTVKVCHALRAVKSDLIDGVLDNLLVEISLSGQRCDWSPECFEF